MTPGPLTPVGLAEIAAICGKTRQAAVRWHHRSVHGQARIRFPEPDGTVSGQPSWLWRTVEPALIKAGWITPEEETPMTYRAYLTATSEESAHPEEVASLLGGLDQSTASELCIALQPHLREGVEAHCVSQNEYGEDSSSAMNPPTIAAGEQEGRDA